MKTFIDALSVKYTMEEITMNEKILRLEKLLQEAIDDGAFPGANYALIVNGKKYFGSLGNKSLYPQVEPNSLDTMYDLASVTKVLATTTAIMMLVEQGKLRLYEPVSNILENFKHSQITVWDLLTHTSGLPADIPRANKLKSRNEALDYCFSCDLVYEKNTKIVYSDIGFILLGLIIEKITKESLDSFVTKNIFIPLKMDNTCYNPKNKETCAPTEERNDEVFQGIIQGYVHDEKAYILGGVAGHAGVFSTVKDMANFLEMILNQGRFDGKQILSKQTIDLFFTPQVRVQNGISLDYDMRSIGWINKGCYSSSGELTSRETIQHTGFTGTNVFIDRKNNIAFCLLTNRVHPTRNNLKIINVRARVGNYIIANFGG